MSSSRITVLGIFVADMAFQAARQPRIGETILGNGFVLGPGGKGSNQAVGAACAGGDVVFLTRLGEDTFGDMAQEIWQNAGVQADALTDAAAETGAAYIFVDQASGDNAIIVCPGAANDLVPTDVDHWRSTIEASAIFMTQFEQPIETAIAALRTASAAGVQTILNPAPAAKVPDEIWPLCSYATPNETEASDLTGVEVTSLDSARRAGDRLHDMGVQTALITLGAEGALLHGAGISEHIPAICDGTVIDTTGAGDAFNAGFAVALADGAGPKDAAVFGSATAGLAVTRQGTARSMPQRAEIEDALARARARGLI